MAQQCNPGSQFWSFLLQFDCLFIINNLQNSLRDTQVDYRKRKDILMPWDCHLRQDNLLYITPLSKDILIGTGSAILPL